jgi:hypothetical protein
MGIEALGSGYKHAAPREFFFVLRKFARDKIPGNHTSPRTLPPPQTATMKFTLLFLSAAALLSAQSVDTVSATQSGVCEPHNDHW